MRMDDIMAMLDTHPKDLGDLDKLVACMVACMAACMAACFACGQACTACSEYYG